MGMDLLPPFVGAAVILFALGAMPAKLILRTLDPAGPSTRHGLMLPATAMLLHLGLAGWSVVLFRGWWPSLFLLMVLGANLIAFRSMRAKTWNWHSTMVTEPTGGWSATNVQRETGLSVIRPEDPPRSEHRPAGDPRRFDHAPPPAGPRSTAWCGLDRIRRPIESVRARRKPPPSSTICWTLDLSPRIPCPSRMVVHPPRSWRR